MASAAAPAGSTESPGTADMRARLRMAAVAAKRGAAAGATPSDSRSSGPLGSTAGSTGTGGAGGAGAGRGPRSGSALWATAATAVSNLSGTNTTFGTSKTFLQKEQDQQRRRDAQLTKHDMTRMTLGQLKAVARRNFVVLPSDRQILAACKSQPRGVTGAATAATTSAVTGAGSSMRHSSKHQEILAIKGFIADKIIAARGSGPKLYSLTADTTVVTVRDYHAEGHERRRRASVMKVVQELNRERMLSALDQRARYAAMDTPPEYDIVPDAARMG